jgi:hypothetical protein
MNTGKWVREESVKSRRPANEACNHPDQFGRLDGLGDVMQGE